MADTTKMIENKIEKAKRDLWKISIFPKITFYDCMNELVEMNLGALCGVASGLCYSVQ